MKRILILLLSLTLVFAFVSCGGSEDNPPAPECTEHVDANTDGKCDTCGATVEIPAPECTEHTDANTDGKCDKCGAAVEIPETVIKLIEDGVANFNFVFGAGINSSLRMEVMMLVDALDSIHVTTSAINETSPATTDYEVLIGDVTTRGDEYKFDKYSLGMEGYAIKVIGTKIIINAGDPAKLADVFALFVSDVLGFEEYETTELTDVSFSSKNNIVEIQDNYAITSFTVNGETLKGYTIAVNKRDLTYNNSAIYLQNALYVHTGNYLPIVSLEEKSEKSIVISKAPDDGEFGFKIYTSGKTLNIDCGFANALDAAMKEFVDATIINGEGDIALDASFLHTKLVRIVTYEEFGAKGDGRTDDFFAIVAAHKYANEGGQTVVAKEGATYYMHNIVDENGSVNSIPIKTNTVWTGAHFILDDRGFNQTDKNNSTVIRISTDHSFIGIDDKKVIEKIFSGTTIDRDNFDKINWSDYGYHALVIIKNEDTKHYIRGPGDENDGQTQQEFIEVDANGNLINNSGLMYDFTNITYVEIYRIDERTVTLTGGTITTIANDRPYRENTDTSPYISRGINISRSGTVIDGLTHNVEGEEEQYIDGEKRHAYSGFFGVGKTVGVTLKNCKMTARRYCKAAGTYDFQASFSNNLTLYNCVQQNFLNEDGTAVSDMKNYWGIGGTNYCKNLTYDSCTLSRFDAHEGLWNGKVINSTVNSLELIGKGDMLIENTTFVVMNTAPIALRGDYGATWEGTITIKDCTYRYTKNLPKSFSVMGNSWYNRDYGYDVYFPNIVIDNLKVENLPATVEFLYITIFSENNTINEDTLLDNVENKNPYTPPEYIKVINNGAGLRFVIKDIPFFENTTLEGGIERE